MSCDVLSAIMFYPRGGSAHAARATAAGLRRQGLSVTLVAGSRGAPGQPGNAHSFYGDVRAVDFGPALASGDPMRFSGPLGTAPMHPSFEDRPGAPDRVFAQLDDLEYEHQVQAWARELARAGAAEAGVLYLHHLTPLNAAAALVAPRVPVVGQLHGTELLMLEQISDGPPAGWRYAQAWARRLRAWAHHCERIVVSPAGLQRASEVLDLPPDRFVALDSGVDTQLFGPRSVDRPSFWREVLAERPRGWLAGSEAGSAHYDAPYAARVAAGVVLVYVGRFTAVKRLDLLIGAFGRARSRARSAASLVLVGGHPGEFEGEHPAQIAERLGVPDVLLAGWYDHDELPPFLAAADAVVLASDREQFGLAVVEGMVCGLPAIATRSLGPAMTVQDGVSGWLVATGDEAALADAMVQAIDDDAERRRRGRRAREIALERFSWPRFTEALAELIAEVRGPAPRGELGTPA